MRVICYAAISQFSSVAQLCLTLCDPMNHSTPCLPVHHQLPEFTQTYVHRVGDAIQPSHPLSSPSPPAPSIRVFSSESTLRMRWPKYWSFSFSISPSNEHPGLISSPFYYHFSLSLVKTVTTLGIIKGKPDKYIAPQMKCHFFNLFIFN